MQTRMRQDQDEFRRNMWQRHVSPLAFRLSHPHILITHKLTSPRSHMYSHGGETAKPDYIHPLANEKKPFVFGHEFGGVVAEVGAGSSRASVGDLVAIRPSLYDGTCEACAQGSENLCRHWGWLGVHASGGLAESIVVDDKLVFRLPAGTAPEVSALVEPLAVGWHATRLVRGPLGSDSTVLITGGGPIGCAVFLALTAQGIKNVVVSEVSRARRDLVGRLGAELVFSPADTDIPAKVKELSGGRGAHAVFDCAGLPVTLETALEALRPRGTIVNVAIRRQPVTQDLNLHLFKEATLVSSHSYLESDWEDVIEALGNGTLKPEGMITRKIGLPDLVEKGIKALAETDPKDCKILVDVQLQG